MRNFIGVRTKYKYKLEDGKIWLWFGDEGKEKWQRMYWDTSYLLTNERFEEIL